MTASVPFQMSHNHMQCSPSRHIVTHVRPQPSRISPRPTSNGPVPRFLSAARIRTTLCTSTNPELGKSFPNQLRHSLLTARASSAQKQSGDSRDSRDALWKLPAAFAAAALCESQAGVANAVIANPAYAQTASFLDNSVQFLYLGALLTLLASGSFLVVRQVLVRRELENAAKELQERVRSGQASSEEYFELGAVMLRKKFYLMADRYLEQAIKKWEGEEQDLAQVHNALGFSYFSEDNVDKAVDQYQKAVKLQPAYVTAWNNLGDALEKKRDLPGALKAYEEALNYEPSNRVAAARKGGSKG